MGKDVEKVNKGVKHSMEEGGTRNRVKYNDYFATERGGISQYAGENVSSLHKGSWQERDNIARYFMNNNYFPLEQTTKVKYTNISF